MFRNKEIKHIFFLFVVMAIIFSAAGFCLHPAAGAIAIISAASFGGIFLLFTNVRYKKIAELSDQIDLVLHGADRLYISGTSEGELSILKSEIAKMTLRIREQNAQLKKEKEALADSLADIAHQLRTPLTSANLTLSLLEAEQDPAKQKSLLRETKTLFAQMEWLINSLLKLSRLDAEMVMFHKEPISVKDLFTAAARPLLISMDLHNIALRTDIPDDLYISGDKNWMGEALQNILKNCIQSETGGGEIEITCKDNPLYTEIVIRDHGAGFEKEDLPHLFERFYKGKNSSTANCGIGLALSKIIILRQGGTITAANHPGGGAAFFIRFPK